PLALEKTSQSNSFSRDSASSTGRQSSGGEISMAGCKSTSAPSLSRDSRNGEACSTGRVTSTRLPNKGRLVNHVPTEACCTTSPTITSTGGRTCREASSSATSSNRHVMVV